MDTRFKALILDILDKHRIMTVATLRPDGWPQATTVGYVHEGLRLYFLCGADSQKAHNLERCDKVSVTIDRDTDEMFGLQGLSMAARAEFITEPARCSEIFKKLIAQYPNAPEISEPPLDSVSYVKLTPVAISVLDYTKGFAHTDLIEIAPDDLD